jgi:hypothetical protein
VRHCPTMAPIGRERFAGVFGVSWDLMADRLGFLLFLSALPKRPPALALAGPDYETYGQYAPLLLSKAKGEA